MGAIDGVPARMDEEFAGFYRDAYPGAVRLGWLLTHDHDAAEDVVQEAFVRLSLASQRSSIAPGTCAPRS